MKLVIFNKNSIIQFQPPEKYTQNTLLMFDTPIIIFTEMASI